VKSQRQKMKMTEKKAKTATPHLRETPEQRQQVEHEEAIEDAGKDGKRVGAGFEKRMAASIRPLALPQLKIL
jgi:flagellar biosynthesis/type III secretory pathway protein FliH